MAFSDKPKYKIDRETIERILDSAKIEEVVGDFVQLKKRGVNLIGLCPFHNEKTPSFTVYPESQSYYCFGCGAGGEAINFIRRAENLDFTEAVRFLCEKAGMSMPADGYDDSIAQKRK